MRFAVFAVGIFLISSGRLENPFWRFSDFVKPLPENAARTLLGWVPRR